jgi:hypothetical protein
LVNLGTIEITNHGALCFSLDWNASDKRKRNILSAWTAHPDNSNP